jgi:hypothetical protein
METKMPEIKDEYKCLPDYFVGVKKEYFVERYRNVPASEGTEQKERFGEQAHRDARRYTFFRYINYDLFHSYPIFVDCSQGKRQEA